MSTRSAENHRKGNHTRGRESMKSLRDKESARPSGSTGMDGESGEGRSGVIGNERLTALAGAVLLVLFVVELVTVPNLRALLHRITCLRAQRSAPLAAASSGPAACGYDPRGDRQRDRTRGDWPALS